MEKPDYSRVNSDYDKIAGLYNIGNTIGRGHYAVVKEAKHVFTEEKVAIKVIDKTKLDAQSREHLFSEVMCMKLVQHPNVVRLYEVIDTVNKLYLVLELGDAGDLYDYIMKYENGLPEVKAKRYFRQIVEAIAYCHNLHVVHRDLKPENVVFFEKLELVKLTDFGFSNKFTPGQTLQTSCGSLAYSAPEILLGDAYDAPKVDIWSLGVILFMLVCGRLPFDEANDSETLSRIMDCRYILPARLSESCQALIRTMLVRAPEDRATLEAILAHEWMEERDLYETCESNAIPLISQEQLSVEEHLDILTKMAEGNLASVEEIQVTLDRGEYSYITATYFLLAERKLKRRHYEQFCKMKLLQLDAQSTDVALASATTTVVNVETASEDRIRRFSMILEDDEVEEEAEELDAMISLASVREELTQVSRCQSRLSGESMTRPCRRQSSSSSTHHSRCRSAIYPSTQSIGHVTRPLSPHSNCDITDTDSLLLLRGYSDQKRISVPKSFGRHFLSLKPHHTKPLTPDWFNSSSCSSIESDGSRCHQIIGRRVRASVGSRPSSMGATMNAWWSSSEDDVTAVAAAAASSPTNVRDICAPIHEEEDELIRSRSYLNGSGEFDEPSQPASVEQASAHTRSLYTRLQTVSGHLTQSNFSLASFASGLRHSKAMMNVVRGAFELQCLANRTRASASGGAGDNANVGGVGCDVSQCEFSSVVSLPPMRIHTSTVTHSHSVRSARAGHTVTQSPSSLPMSAASPPLPLVAAMPPPTGLSHSQASIARHHHNHDTHTNILLTASATLSRKARFILSCCRTS